MKLTPMQDQLHEALLEVDEAYIAEALRPRNRAIPQTLKRLAAVAAAFAILVGILFFIPNSSDGPIFSVTVKASDDLNVMIHVTADLVPLYAPNTGHIKDSLDPDWFDRELFHVHVEILNATEEYLKNTYVVIEFADQLITADADTDQLAVRFPEDKTSNAVCDIYGWAKDIAESMLTFDLNIYHTNNDEKTLILSRPFNAYYHPHGDLMVDESISDSNVSWFMNLLSTEQLVRMIATHDNPPLIGLLADPSRYYDKILFEYADILSVLSTRDDAAAVMLSYLGQLEQTEVDDHWGNIDVLCELLYNEPYVDQLSVEDLAWLSQFIDSLSW